MPPLLEIVEKTAITFYIKFLQIFVFLFCNHWISFCFLLWFFFLEKMRTHTIWVKSTEREWKQRHKISLSRKQRNKIIATPRVSPYRVSIVWRDQLSVRFETVVACFCFHLIWSPRESELSMPLCVDFSLKREPTTTRKTTHNRNASRLNCICLSSWQWRARMYVLCTRVCVCVVHVCVHTSLTIQLKRTSKRGSERSNKQTNERTGLNETTHQT